MLQDLQAQHLVVFKASIGRYDAAAVILVPPDEDPKISMHSACKWRTDRVCSRVVLVLLIYLNSLKPHTVMALDTQTFQR
jgi:hypothetical protein